MTMMKRLVLCLLLAVAAIGAAWGQKTYVNVVADHIYSSVYQEIYVTGDLPAGIKSHYDGYGSSAMTVGVLLNLLAKEGFVVDQMSCSAEGEVIILSKPSAPESDRIEHITIDDQDVHRLENHILPLPIRDGKIQRDGERRSLALLALTVDHAAHQIHHLFCDGKSESGP